MAEQDYPSNFERVVLPHLDAAYNLARWLTRSQTDAEDVVQESYLRALRFFDGFRGENSRAWLLTIVRNTCYSWIKKNHLSDLSDEFDETVHSGERPREDAESKLLSKSESERVKTALASLGVAFREILVLREIEGLSYREISQVTGVPMGTVMSSLSRARRLLRQQLSAAEEDGPHERGLRRTASSSA